MMNGALPPGTGDGLFSVAADSFDGYRPTGVEHVNATLGTLVLASHALTDGMPASASPLSVTKAIVLPVAGSFMPKRWRSTAGARRPSMKLTAGRAVCHHIDCDVTRQVPSRLHAPTDARGPPATTAASPSAG
ncbi:hypothetical protein C6V06_31700 [Burkholderia gladioli]|nr:hypothetical protein C6V06_31700 [Burkholderia gladioli]